MHSGSSCRRAHRGMTISVVRNGALLSLAMDF